MKPRAPAPSLGERVQRSCLCQGFRTVTTTERPLGTDEEVQTTTLTAKSNTSTATIMIRSPGSRVLLGGIGRTGSGEAGCSCRASVAWIVTSHAPIQQHERQTGMLHIVGHYLTLTPRWRRWTGPERVDQPPIAYEHP
jgi:hypothetical protein